MSLADELRRRNVLRVLFAYLVVGWLLTEVLTTILPELGAPAWAPRMVILAFALGFLPATVLPWLYELTPDGIKRESDIAKKPDDRTTSKIFDYAAIAATVVLVLVIAVLGARQTTDEPQHSGTPVAQASVAVLPFVNMTGDERNDYFSDGLTETLLHMLAQIPDLQVAARTSSFAFRGQSVTIGEVAKALNVAHILEGSVQLAGNRVRITAQLIRAADGFHLWSSSFDRDFDDIFKIQDEIATEVGTALSASILGTEQQATVAGVGTESPDAYDLYLQALGERAKFSYGGLQAAEDLLKAALSIDPAYDDAKTELALNYLHQLETGLMGREEAVARAEAMAAQVLAGNPDDMTAEAIRLYVANMDSGDGDAVLRAIEQLEELVSSKPSNYTIRLLLAQLFERVGHYDQALIVQLEALQNDPLNPRIQFELGQLYLGLGRPQDARAALQKSLELEPEQPNVYARLAQAAMQSGDGVAAVKNLLRAMEVDARDYELPGSLALTLYDLGLVEQGDDFRNRVLAIAPTSEIVYEIDMRRGVSTGDEPAAVEAARRAVEDDISERRGGYSRAVELLLRSAIKNDTVAATFEYLDSQSPGLLDVTAESASPKYREAQVAALDAWYATLSREDLLQRLEALLAVARSFGIDPLEDPAIRMEVHALRGETEQAIAVALEHVFPRTVMNDLRWREKFALPHFAEIVADPRVEAALQRWEAEYGQQQEQVRRYLSELSSAT
jgi:TolB-like protein/Tfp pilus assembly protein PilF